MIDYGSSGSACEVGSGGGSVEGSGYLPWGADVEAVSEQWWSHDVEGSGFGGVSASYGFQAEVNR